MKTAIAALLAAVCSLYPIEAKAASAAARRVSPSWGRSLGALFRSPAAKRAGLNPLISALRSVDIESARERAVLAPVVAELAKHGYSAQDIGALARASDSAGLRDILAQPSVRFALEAARADISSRRADRRAAKIGNLLRKAQDAMRASPEASQAARLVSARESLSRLAPAGPEGLPRLSTENLIGYARSKEFRSWAASEKAAGRELFVMTDLDKTMAAGDIFTFYFKWRADNGLFSPKQGDNLRAFLTKHQKALSAEESARAQTNSASQNADLILELWKAKKLGLLEVWNDAYWPSLEGLPRKERRREAAEFAYAYAEKIYPGVLQTNKAMAAAGAHVVIVSNGDQVLAEAVAPLLGVNPRNVVGAGTLYGKNGIATGHKRTYEEETAGPQPGKRKAFRLYLIRNKWRGWKLVDERNRVDWRKVVVVGTMGDSAGPDGGMALHGRHAVLGDFMIDTPGEPDRLQKFIALMRESSEQFKYDLSRLFVLDRKPSKSGAMP